MGWMEEKFELEERLSRIERQLREVTERYALATAAAKVGVWDWNLESNAFYLDPNIKSFLGYTDTEIPNDINVWSGFVHPDDKEPVMKAAQDAIDGRAASYVFEHRMCHKDGSIRWFLVRGEVIRDEHHKPIRFVGTDTDITDRRRLEQHARELSNRIQTQIGHDLHDGLGQELTGISLMLKSLESQLKKEESQHADRAREIRELAQSAAATTRSLAQGLSPVVRTSGLTRSLGQLAINTRKLHGIDCRVEMPREVPDRFSDVAANELYCIVREAVTNAIKHGKATLIEIEGRIVGQRLLLNISDNGKGFVASSPESPAVGLRIMQYRARDLGGSLTISPRRTAGTLVVCSCPIPPA